MTILTVPKPPHGSAEWLAVRWKDERGQARISASAAAAVHGEHRWTTPADLAGELLAVAPPAPKATNAAMERGNALEPALLDWVGTQLKTQIWTPDVLYVAGRMIATLDGVTGDVKQPDRVIEAKTTRERWTGTLPATWRWQGVQQAICAEQDRILWVILDGALDLHLYEQTVEGWEKSLHSEKVEEFLAAIDMGFAPPFVALSLSHVAGMHPEPTEVSVELPDEAAQLLKDLVAAKQQAKAAKQTEDELKAQLGLWIGDAEVGRLHGDNVVTWRAQSRESFDARTFQSEHPDLYRKYVKNTTMRVMRVKGEK